MNAAQTFLPIDLPPPDLQQIKSGGRTVMTLAVTRKHFHWRASKTGRHASRAENVHSCPVSAWSPSAADTTGCAHPGKPHRIIVVRINLDDLRLTLTQATTNQAKEVSTDRTRLIRLMQTTSYLPARIIAHWSWLITMAHR